MYPNDFTLYDPEENPKQTPFAGMNIDQAAQAMAGNPVITLPAAWNQGFLQTQPQPQPQQPADVNNKYLEPYMQLFSQYLTPPKNDEARQRRLQNASLLNALGNSLTNVVNSMHAANAPIIPVTNQRVVAPMAEAERLRQEYVNQQDQYDRLRLSTMWNATQMAKQDQRQDFLDQQNAANVARQEQWRKEDVARQDQWRKEDKDYNAERDKTQHGYRMEEMDKETQARMKVLGVEQSNRLAAIEKEYGMKAADAVGKIAAKDGYPVIDGTTGKTVALPKEIYMDILQKEISKQNKDFGEFVTSTDFNATDNAADVMVSKYWREYYDPQYDAAGNVTGFTPKGTRSGKAGSWTGGATQQPAQGTQPQNVPTYFN